MGLTTTDVNYIARKRRIYLTLYVAVIICNVTARFYHPGFAVLGLVLLVAFLTQFLPAASRAGYSNGVLIGFTILLIVPCVGILALAIIDNNLYKTIRGARGVH